MYAQSHVCAIAHSADKDTYTGTYTHLLDRLLDQALGYCREPLEHGSARASFAYQSHLHFVGAENRHLFTLR